jgi:hypothetical protein
MKIHRLTAAEFDALTTREPKLSRIPPAHWRGVFQMGPRADAAFQAAYIVMGAEWLRGDPLGGGIWRERIPRVSAEFCETRGLRFAGHLCRVYGPGECQFLRAQKFEGEAP